MKTIKSILIAATLICATAVSTMSAQQAAAPAKEHQWNVSVGDSVMIKPECQQYLTGEKPSVWVYDKVHTVRQLGTKRFPEGVLLMNIYSWICEECLTTVSSQPKAEKPAEAAQPAEQVAQPVQEAKAEEKAQPAQEAKAEAAVAPAEQAAQPAQEAKAEEKAQPAQEAPVAQPAQEAKADEAAAPAEEAAQPAEEKAEQKTQLAQQGDTLSSKQQFRHGYDRFTIGLRGGVASQLHQAVANVDAKWGIGGDVLLDLQYAHYWTKDGRPVDLGLIVGLSAGYAQGSFTGSENSNFVLGDNLQYTVKTTGIKETDRQIQLEVPVMFSLIHQSGLFFNFGPKFMIPVFTPFSQTINTPDIAAYDLATGVTYDNNIVTGKYMGEQPTGNNGLQFKINVMLTAEIGYEWILKSGNSLGLGAYANYSVYNSRQQLAAAANPSLISITPPSNLGTGSIASLSVLSATSTYAKSVGYFDVGVKIAYHFNFPKKQYKHFKDTKLF